METKIIKANGEEILAKPKNGKNFSLEELKEIVGGYIEVTHTIYPDFIMVVNDEGKLENLPFNEKASKIHYNPYDPIMGDVLVCKNSQVK